MAKFIWGGGRDKRSIHLAKWEVLTLPKDRGGWGILDMEIFGNSLIIKSLWRCLHGKGKWHDIIKHKYLGRVSVEDMGISGWIICRCRLNIWKGFGNMWPVIMEHMKWVFGNGSKILIGSRKLLGMDDLQPQIEDLVHMLNQRGIFFIQQIIDVWAGEVPRWKSFVDLGLDINWEGKWLQYTTRLNSMGLCRMTEGGRLLWEGKEAKEGLKAKEIYLILIKRKVAQDSDCWFKALWKSRVQTKMIIFLWLVWEEKSIT